LSQPLLHRHDVRNRLVLIYTQDLVAYRGNHTRRIRSSAHDEIHEIPRNLSIRKISFRHYLDLKRLTLNIADNADDLSPFLLARILFQPAEPLTNRILVGPITAGQRLIDDDYVRSFLAILLGE